MHTSSTGCRVDYVKNGSAHQLWSADTDRQYCETRAHALAAKLARGNFRCSEAGKSNSIASEDAASQSRDRATPIVPAGQTDLTEDQIRAANLWLRQRVEAVRKTQTVSIGPDAKRYSATPDFLAAADLDADGRIDLVVGWSWASFRCDGTYLTVLINDASNAKPVYRPAEVQLPGNCGAKGWLSSVKDVKARRLYIELKQRFPGAGNVQQISATLGHGGSFTFFDPTGRPASLAAIEKALPTKFQ